MATSSATFPDKATVQKHKDNARKIIDVEPHASTISEALGIAFKVYFEGYESLAHKEVSQTAQERLASINCRWLDFDGIEYQCRELFHKKKKTQSLGDNASKILKGCTACKDGQTEQENKQTRKMLKGRTIKTFRQITKFMADIVKSGLPGTITFCNRLNPPTGTGMPTIFCSKHDQSVDINKVCKDGPCEFLEQYHIKIHSEFAEKALAQIEQIASEYEQLEGPPIKKDVDVEQVDPDVEPQ